MDEPDGEWILPEPMAWPLDESSAYVACGVLRAHGIAAFVWHPFAGGLPHCSPVPNYVLAVEAGAAEDIAAIFNSPAPEEPPEGWEYDPTAEVDPKRIGPPDLMTWLAVFLVAPALVIAFSSLVQFGLRNSEVRRGVERFAEDAAPGQSLTAEQIATILAGGCAAAFLTWLLLLPVGAALRGGRSARMLLKSLIWIYLAFDILAPLLLLIYLHWAEDF